MRTLLIASLVLLAAAVPAQAKRRAFCDTRPGATIVADGSHRVYERVIPVKGDPDADVTTVYSCTSGTRKASRRVVRFKNTIDGAIRPASGKLAGRWLLLDLSEETGVSAGASLQLYDLVKHRKQTGVYDEGADKHSYVLTPSGAFAAYFQDTASVIGFDAAGRHDLAGEDATDLAAGGQHVYWTEKGVVGSTVLGAAPTGAIPSVR